jgi:hypothetical protein
MIFEFCSDCRQRLNGAHLVICVHHADERCVVTYRGSYSNWINMARTVYVNNGGFKPVMSLEVLDSVKNSVMFNSCGYQMPAIFTGRCHRGSPDCESDALTSSACKDNFLRISL